MMVAMHECTCNEAVLGQLIRCSHFGDRWIRMYRELGHIYIDVTEIFANGYASILDMAEDPPEDEFERAERMYLFPD